jgi:N-acetyl-anhydromuramyl-L-alanine amidase AmpD
MTEMRKTPNKSKALRDESIIDTIIIHYTGSMSTEGTLQWFGNNDAKVSAHYVISRTGKVFQYENWRTTLWHAGKSEWNGRSSLNGTSIGIELVGTYHSGFELKQMASLWGVLRDIYRELPIKYVLGHEQVSPGRKTDPGPSFDWTYIRTQVESDHIPGLERVGPYTVQPPDLPRPVVAIHTTMPSGDDTASSLSLWEVLSKWLNRIDLG